MVGAQSMKSNKPKERNKMKGEICTMENTKGGDIVSLTLDNNGNNVWVGKVTNGEEQQCFNGHRWQYVIVEITTLNGKPFKQSHPMRLDPTGNNSGASHIL